MKKYTNPEIELVLLQNEDVISTSLTENGVFAFGDEDVAGSVWSWT